jgi:hypothetical protein
VFPWGTIRAGRILDGLAGTAGGLASLGYNPVWGSDFLYANVFDSGDPVDGITYTNKWDNGFGLAVYYVKPESRFGFRWYDYFDDWQDWRDFANTTGNCDFLEGCNFKDSDHDVFGVEGSYEWEGGGATLGLEYHRDMTNPLVEKNYSMFVTGAVMQNFGPFAIHFEGKVGWGKTVFTREFASKYADPSSVNVQRDAGVGFYLDGVYNYGPGDVTLATWYVSGTDFDDSDNPMPKRNNLVDLGDFAPFLVAHNSTTLGNGIYSNNLGWEVYEDGGTFADCSPAQNPESGDCTWGNPGRGNGLQNQWGIAILGRHQITPEIKLNYGIGYFRLVHPNVRWWIDGGGNGNTIPYWNVYQEQSRDLGWEIDVGATFQILDNLSFETQFGYMFNGKAYDQPQYDATTGEFQGMKSAKDTFAWANVLSFTF